MGSLAFWGTALLSGLAFGRARGGNLRGLAGLPIHHAWLIGLALALQLLRSLPPIAAEEDLAQLSLGLSYSSSALWLMLNGISMKVRGVRAAAFVIAVGWASNAVVILANGEMPVSQTAARLVSTSGPDGFDRSPFGLTKHEPSSEDTHLRWLGDVVPLEPLRIVISPGDMALWLGVAGLIGGAMRAGGAGVAAPPRGRHASDA